MLRLPEQLGIDPAWLPPSIAEAGARFRVRFSDAEKRSLVKRPPIRPSDWVERHIELPEDSAIPGRFKFDNMPHLRGILDASFHPSVQEIICCWPPQCAKTTLGLCAMGYATDRAPGNFLVVYADEKTGRENVKDRIVPMFQSSKRLKEYLTPYDDDITSARIKLIHRKIYLGWASSVASMANKPLPYGILDEEDKSADNRSHKEAAPPNLIRKRMRTFAHMRKFWRFSSPSDVDGPIWLALNKDAEAIFDFHLRCSFCGHFGVMQFKHIKWPGGSGADPKQIETKQLAWYECPKCGEHWDDGARDRAARLGEWRDREEGLNIESYLNFYNPRVIGSHFHSWQSCNVSMSEAVAQFIRGQKDLDEFKDFKNGHESVPWAANRIERKVDALLKLRDDRPEGMVPGSNQVAAITFGVDTQDHGFWYTLRAWGYGLDPDSWLIRAGYVTSWPALVKVLWQSEYRDVAGDSYAVAFGLQDAMGHRTDEVYNFCIANRGFILPAQGVDRMSQHYTRSNREVLPGSKKPIPGGVELIRVNTLFFKNKLARKLGVKPGDPGAFYFYSDYPEDFAMQLTVETLDQKGVWKCPKGADNHLWDCEYLAMVAYELHGIKYWPVPNPEASSEDDGQQIVAQSSYITG